MALNNLGLGFIFTARNLASGTIRRLDRQVGGLAGQTRRAGTTMRAGFAVAAAGAVTMAVGFGTLAVAARAGVRANREFAAAIAEVETLLPEQERNTEALRNSVLDLTATYGGEAPEQARALYQTISAGITDAADAQNVLDVANRNAVAGVTDVNTSVDLLTSALNSYGLEASEAESVSDILLTTVRLGKTTMGELGTSLGRVLPAARGLGISLEEVGASIAAMTQGGLQTRRAVTGMNAAISNIRRPTREAQEEAQRLGLEFNSTALRAQGLQGFMQGITTNAKFNATSLELLFGSVQAVNAVTSLTNDNMEVFNDSLEQLQDTTGATADAFAVMAATFDFQIKRLEGRFNVFTVRIGELVEPVLLPFVTALSDLIQLFLDMPTPMQRIVLGTGLVTLAVIGLAGALALVAALVVIIAPVFVAMVKIMAIIAAAFFPVIVIALALGAAIATMVFIVRENIGGLGDFFDETFGRVQLAFRALVQLFSEGALSGQVREELGTAENEGLRAFVINLFRIGSRIKAFFDGVVSGFQSFAAALGPRVERMIESFREIGRALGFVEESTEGLADTPMDTFVKTGVRVGEVIADVMGFVVDAITAISQTVGGFIKGLRKTFLAFEPLFDALFETFSSLGAEIAALFRELGIFTDEGGSGFETFGQVIGAVVGIIVTVFTALLVGVLNIVRFFVGIARFIIGAWEPVKTFFVELGIGIAEVFDSIVTTIANAVDRVIGVIGDAASVIGITGLGDSEDASARIRRRDERQLERSTARRQVVAERITAESAAEVTAKAAVQTRESTSADVVAELRAGREQDRRERLAEAQRPITVAIDGEAVATAVASADRRAGARGFVPVPADAG